MSTNRLTVDDVYGVTREIPRNYESRSDVDDEFVDALSRKAHIVSDGSSKQGKTCLRKYCLDHDDYIMVQCSNKWSVGDLHAQVLKESGFEVTRSTTTTVGGKAKIVAKLSGKFFGQKAEMGGEAESS